MRYLLIAAALILAGCEGMPYKQGLLKEKSTKKSLIVGNVLYKASDGELKNLEIFDFVIRDKSMGARYDYLDASVMDKRGYFAMALPPGNYRLEMLDYYETWSDALYKYERKAKIPLNIEFEVFDDQNSNLGLILVEKKGKAYSHKVYDNQSYIEKYVKQHEYLSDGFKAKPIQLVAKDALALKGK